MELSDCLLKRCRRRMRRGDSDVRLMMADTHALPFPDWSFEQALHVGGMEGYRESATALAEMAQVARLGTPLVGGRAASPGLSSVAVPTRGVAF
ncbi:hypothetical protein BHS09_02365 [Myxococcus xanthus]|uniref:Methyltransferase type 11 domain-containing protein n=1 Tax=Myxococcus xanthus TaxID=34 RepID=A0AAE6FV72_MYXXA|nr:hypothetical protein BHS09_02365 [Myxococcus xanthus]QDE73210.1 hypothetical protein BHS08_02365 [Myxococcus xanthus]